jgi:hypothetical protein
LSFSASFHILALRLLLACRINHLKGIVLMLRAMGMLRRFSKLS